MRPAIWRPSAMVLAAIGLVLGGVPARAAQSTAEGQLEEVIVTHKKLGPLSDWALMQAHNAEYQRLKQKFDPSPNNSAVDKWSAARAAAAAPRGGPSSFAREVQEGPASPIVQAIKESASPP